MTDVITSGGREAELRPRRWRHASRWVWPVVALVVLGVIVVPPLRRGLADHAARWLQHQWAPRSAYDDARSAVIQQVVAEAGVTDGAVVDRAVRAADREEAAVLSRMHNRIAGHHVWAADVGAAKRAATAALAAETRLLQADAEARRPVQTYLTTPVVTSLTARADRVIASTASRHHAGPAPAVGVRLNAARADLAQLAKPTDVPTGLRLVTNERDGQFLYDLDTGRRQELGSTGNLLAVGAELVGDGPAGVRLVSDSGRSTPVLADRNASVLPFGNSGFWVSTGRRVRRYDLAGHPHGRWSTPPGGLETVAATRTALVLESGGDFEGAQVVELWFPATGATRPLPRPCSQVSTSARTVVFTMCGHHTRSAVYDVPTGRLSTRLLPADLDLGLSVTLSPDGSLAVVGTAGNRAAVVDLRTRAVTPIPHPGGTFPVAWSADGRWLLLGASVDSGLPSNGPAPFALWNLAEHRLMSVRIHEHQIDGVPGYVIALL